MSRDPRPGADPALVAEVLAVAARLRDPEGDPQLEAVKTAILLEDSLGIVLTDDDIRALDDPAAVARLVEGRGGA